MLIAYFHKTWKDTDLHWASNLSRADSNLSWAASTHKSTWPCDHVFLRDFATKQNHYIFNTISNNIPQTKIIIYSILYPISNTMASAFARVGIYNVNLLSMKSKNCLIWWSWKVTWKTKFVISVLLQGLWPLNLARW